MTHTDLNWEYLRVHFEEIVSDINPNNYETKTLIYSDGEEDLKKKGLEFLGKDNEIEPEFDYIGEGYYTYSSMGHAFRRLDEIYSKEIYTAILAKNEIPETFWGEFNITKRMNEMLVHIENRKES